MAQLPRLTITSWHLSLIKLEGHISPALLELGAFVSWVRTPDEFSLCIETSYVPANVSSRSDGWGCIMVEGPLDFGLTGILAKISHVLAQENISIFAISTFDTDYILVKQTALAQAKSALVSAGYMIN